MWCLEAVMRLSLLVCAKAAGRKSLLRRGRQWPASGAPGEENERRKRGRGRWAVSVNKKKKVRT